MAKIQDIRNRTQRTNGTRKLSQIKYIVRHHSATKDGNFDSFWRHWKGTRGWGTGGYHEIILRDGTVQLCYNPEEITNGVLNMNTVCFHICLVGNGSFTAAQEKAWDERVAYYMDLLDIEVNNVKGHGELQSNTACPGIDMDVVRGRIKGSEVKPTPKPKPTPTKPNKSISQMATEVIDGLHGNGHANRRKSLGISQAEYDKVRAEVNRRAGIITAKPKPKKTVSQMATEVINGEHGNGHENRRKSLGISKAEYSKVSVEVNRRLGYKANVPSKSINQMATEVIAGKHGNGHANRKKSLGVSESVYQQVRKEVNRRS